VFPQNGHSSSKTVCGACLTTTVHAGYHHQVSHHIHCNDEALDEDVFSSFPLLRFDARMPKLWWHQFQHIYMWFTFPLLQVAFQITDILSLVAGRTAGASLYGASNLEKATTLLGKAAHFSLLLAIPLSMHSAADVLPAWVAYWFTQGVVLSATFAVSHNVPETKPMYEGAEPIAGPVRSS
jgi:acyl-lipid (7-3)-desaturase (Delta-4 desaturase)